MEPGTLRRPLLSVTMPNYNHARFLPEALDSLLAQTLQPDEIIIIDDGSTDNSWAILERYAALHPHIRLLRNEQNQGVLANLRRLLALAQGEFFFGMAADDRIAPTLFEHSIAMLRQYPQAGLCSTRSYLIDHAGVRRGTSWIPFVATHPVYLAPRQVRTRLLRSGNWMEGNTTIYRRERLIEAGGYITELGAFCDGFIMQVIALRHGACFIPDLLAEWRRAPTGYASSLFASRASAFSVHDYALRLMRTTYADLFSKAYAALWSRTYHANFELALWGQAAQAQRQARQQWRALRPGSLADTGFGTLLALLQGVQSLLIYGYLASRYQLIRYWATRWLMVQVAPKYMLPKPKLAHQDAGNTQQTLA